MRVSRSRAEAIARAAVVIIHDGRYTNLVGETVDLADDLARAVAGTVDYPPHASPPRFAPAGHRTRFEVANETTLAAADRLVREGERPAALNFASARHPGGGFLRGAQAQEESLCRASGLYACIRDSRMYAAGAGTDGLYTDWAIYSPDVPVFFTDAGHPLPRPYPCSFITCAAVNAGVYLDRPGRSTERVREAMRRRVDRVLAIAAGHEHAAVILGAWGCGVFRNDPEVIAGLFREAFDGRFAGVFRRAAFAVLDATAARGTIGPFERRFGTT
jgi:uncharacterized protein (TIGR02452 family)